MSYAPLEGVEAERVRGEIVEVLTREKGSSLEEVVELPCVKMITGQEGVQV
jgi:hypothetical protein